MIVCDSFLKTCNHGDFVFCHAGEQSRMRKAEHRSSEEEVVECSRRLGLRKRLSFLMSLSTSNSTSVLIRYSLYLFTVRAIARYNLERNEQEGALEWAYALFDSSQCKVCCRLCTRLGVESSYTQIDLINEFLISGHKANSFRAYIKRWCVP